MTDLVYTGIGSRETPENILELMFEIGKLLANRGWILRSGGAEGADDAFELGVLSSQNPHLAEIFLPWQGFCGKYTSEKPIYLYDNTSLSDAKDISMRVIPHWDRLSASSRNLHGRNAYQVFGKCLTSPTKCLILWTPGGLIKGGTATAIKLAYSENIPIFNLYFPETRSNLVNNLKRISS